MEQNGNILVANNNLMNIEKQLDYYIQSKNIPHLIFHGEPNTGKKKMLMKFLNKLYGTTEKAIEENALIINCTKCNGIKDIKEEIISLLKINPNTFANCSFKSVVLFNADSLTSDAQSSLRRCIEQNSNTTRFFIVVQNINSLLDPILSRFSLIFFNKLVEDKPTFFLQDKIDVIICDKFSQFLNMEQTYIESIKSIISMADYFSSKGISCINLVEFVRKNKNWWDDDKHCSMCFVFFNNNCLQIKNEKIIMYLFMLKLFID